MSDGEFSKDRASLLPVSQACVWVTGGRGFVGARLVRALRKRRPGWTFVVPAGPETPGGLDVTDALATAAALAADPPDLVVHLAAIAAVTSSVKDPRQAWDVNLGGTLNVVMALQAVAPRARVLHISSAEVYGASFDAPGPLDETAPMRPMNPYAASKAAADLLVGQAARAGLPAAIVRPFNHTGPGQSEAFVVPSLAGQIARIEAGAQPPVLHVGSLDEERDFLDVADVVDAYVRIIEGDAFGANCVFNVASGQAVRIGDLLERLLSLARVPIEVRQDSTRLRAAPLRRVVGDSTALRTRLAWAPRIPLAATLTAMLEWKRRSGIEAA